MTQSRFGERVLSRPTLLLTICGILCCCAAKTAAADDALQSRYQGKQVMLRDFYCGSELRFDMDGKLVAGGPGGPWTLCLEILIDRIGVKQGKLEIEGRRVPLFYDSKRKQFRNVLEVADKKRGSYRELASMQEVSIEALLPASVDDRTLAVMLNKLFYSSDTEFTEAAPDFWKSFFGRSHEVKTRPNPDSDRPAPEGGQLQHTDSTGQTSPATVSDGGKEVLRVGRGVDPPVPVYQPDPDYSEAAHKARFQGTVVIAIVIGPDGKVYRPRVSRPLGLGLDEKARDKVLTWKFRPATKDGKPVAVEVSVEVQFNLY